MRVKFWSVNLGFTLTFSIFTFSTAKADRFEFLDSIHTTHGIFYGQMAAKDGYIALGDVHMDENGIEIIDTSDPAQMQLIGFSNADHMTYFSDWSGNYLYIPGGWDGLNIYDVTIPSSISRVAQMPIQDSVPMIGVGVRNNLAYVGADYNGLWGALYCVNVQDPAHPRIIWASDTLHCDDIVLGQNLLYSFAYCLNIRIIDISNPTQPSQIVRVPCSYVNAIDVDESRNLLYATCFFNGLKIYDISNPLSPQLLSTTLMPNGTQCIDVCHSKSYHQIIFVAGHGGGTWAFDTTDPSHPIATASYFPPSGMSAKVLSRGNIVFLTAQHTFISLRYEYGTGLDESETPASFSLMQNYPNPFNSGTSISCALPECSNIRLEIYDALGRKIETLYRGIQSAGNATFQWDASGYPSGNYFYGLTVEGKSEYRKMMLIK